MPPHKEQDQNNEIDLESRTLAVQEIPPELQDSFTVNIRGEKRLIKFTNPLEIPKKWYEIGLQIGRDLSEYFGVIESYLKSGGLEEITGLETDTSRRMAEMADYPNAFSNFVPSADIAVSENGHKWSILEINTRPASIGDAILLSQFLGENKYITPDGQDILQSLILFLQNTWGENYAESSALISHPHNPFYPQHTVLATTLGLPTTSLQHLEITQKGAFLDNRSIRSLVRQCSSAALFDEKICHPQLLELWKRRFLDIIPGPLNTLLGEKFLLKLFPHQDTWIPQGEYLDKPNDFSAKEHQGYWLKGEGDKSGEITIFISEKMAKGSRGKFINALVRRDYQEAAMAIANISGSNDGLKFAGYLSACSAAHSTRWVLQKDIDPIKVEVEGYPKPMRTVLRVHFVPSTDPNSPYLPFMQFYAADQVRVSAGGFTIPLYLR